MNKKRGEMSLVVAILMLFFLTLSMGGLLYIYKDNLDKQKIADENNNKVNKETAVGGNNTEQNINTKVSTGDDTEKLKKYTIDSSLAYELEVNWKDPPIESSNSLNDICKGWRQQCQYFEKIYNVGKIKNGDLAGYDIYIGGTAQIGDSLFYGQHIIYGREYALFLDKIFKIKGITDIPEEINYPGTEYKLRKSWGGSLFLDNPAAKKIFSIENLGDFYLPYPNYCPQLKLPDSTVLDFNFDYSFFNKENGLLSIIFNDGKINEENYESYSGILDVCSGGLRIIDSTVLKPEERLKIAAQTDAGELFYEFKDQNDPTLKELYENKNTLAYREKPIGEYAFTYPQFLNLHPLLYWKDPMGRWVEFKNRRFAIAAEKGKPVIYLYPTEKVKLNVKVEPNGGFTKTIPKYPDGGWNVEATPDSKITDLRDSKQYDYLFWSGWGIDYPIDEKGWVVKKEELGNFFDDKLVILGLNKKEISDFKEYWVGEKLVKDPYYQISFITKEQMDAMSPLEIAPLSPDTVIRVMMTAKGLKTPVSVVEEKLPKTPIRRGFIVVEWGGTLLR